MKKVQNGAACLPGRQRWVDSERYISPGPLKLSDGTIASIGLFIALTNSNRYKKLRPAASTVSRAIGPGQSSLPPLSHMALGQRVADYDRADLYSNRN